MLSLFSKRVKGNLNLLESESLLRNAFESMKEEGKFPAHLDWNSKLHKECFDLADINGNGYLAIDEISNVIDNPEQVVPSQHTEMINNYY